MRKPIIHISDGIARNPAVRFSHPVGFLLEAGEHLAVIGPNGSGKSLLIDMLLGKYPLQEGDMKYDFSPAAGSSVYENIKYISFRDTYGSADASYYYQQRWNSTEQEDAPVVRGLLGDFTSNPLSSMLIDLFDLELLLDKKVILLSSGELRKFQLTKALLSSPRVLVVDNPYIGLDAVTRDLLDRLLSKLTSLPNLQIVLVLSLFDRVPECITHVVPVNNRTILNKITRATYSGTLFGQVPDTDHVSRKVTELPDNGSSTVSDVVVNLNKVSIRYGDRTILKDLDWTIRKGEKWALTGANGSGKSTLLSLICADNPQSYACDITLFGRKRGTGESIWDIKQHIGYVSPEMHRAYLKNIPAIEIVASGLHDSIGLYKKMLPGQLSVCEWWMDIFGIRHLKSAPFLQLSSGEQRLALLARAFVKDPELLILDEPLHGLDTFNRCKVRAIIESFSGRPGKTIIMVTHYDEELPGTITNRLTLNKISNSGV